MKAPPVPTHKRRSTSTASAISHADAGVQNALKHLLASGHRKHDTSWRIPLVSCDYLYITRNGLFEREELSEQEREASARVLVMFLQFQPYTVC